MVSERKVEIVDELTEDIRESEDLVFADFQGLTVDKFETLRQDLYEEDSRFQVVKNRLAERAFRRAFSGEDQAEAEDDETPEETDEAADVELTDISGLGPSKVEALEDEGFETVESIAGADPDALEDVSGVGETTAEKFIEGARELAGAPQEDDPAVEDNPDSGDVDESLLDEINDILTGNTAIALSGDGYVNVAEVLVEFAEENEELRIKGGLMNGGFLEPDEVESVSELPSRRELLTSIAGSLQKPLQNLVHHLRYPLQNLVRTLDEVRNQKEENES